MGDFPPLSSLSVATTFAVANPLYSQFKTLIENAKSIFVTAHVGPDGDTLGSMLALKHALTKAYPHIERFDCVISGKMPDIYAFMPGIEDVKAIEVSESLLLPVYDVGISVDCGSLGRLGEAKRYFNQAKAQVNIDHHISNEGFGQLNIIEPVAAASGEVIANILDDWGVAIDYNTAVCLYVTLLTDTGGFRHSGTTPKVFALASRLQAAGVDVTKVYQKIFEEKPRCQALLHAKCVLESKTALAGKLVWTFVPQALLTEFNALEEHVEGLIDLLREMKHAQVSVVLKETPEGTTKLSLRSNTDAIDVASLLGKLYNGGGHKKAAGASVPKPINVVAEELLPAIEALILAL
jgi:phosphoesterase RecJ-like protein